MAFEVLTTTLLLAYGSRVAEACFASGICGGLSAGCGAGALLNPLFRPTCQSGGCGGGVFGNSFYNPYTMNPYSGLNGYNNNYNSLGLSGSVCGPYGCYRHRSRAAVTFKPDQLKGFGNETIDQLNSLSKVSPSAALHFVQRQKSSVNPNRAFVQCCMDRHLPDACLRKCHFGVYRKDMKDDCPIEAMQEIHFCAAQGRDHRQCCQRNGVSTTLAGEKCLVFCDQRPGNVVQLDMSYMPCFERFDSMKTCFYNDLTRRH